MKDNFKRILELAKRTGGTLIVTDPDGENVFVLMDIDQYEMLTDLDQEMDYYPDDWVSDNDYEIDEVDELDSKEVDEQKVPEIWDTMLPAGKKGDTWDISKMSENEIVELEKQYRSYTNQGAEEAIDIVNKSEEENIEVKKIQNEEDFGEEQFYLEPVE